MLLALALAALAAAAPTEPIAIASTVNAREVSVGDIFELDVIVTVRTQTPLEELTLPDLSQLTIVKQGRSQATQLTTASGGRSVSTEYRYQYLLRADRPGSVVIGEAHARVGKSVARAAPIKIAVGGKGAASSSAAARTKDDVPRTSFLDVRFDKESAYVGEQVVLTAEVLTKEPLDEWPRAPALKPPGFWVQTLEQGGRGGQPTQRTVNGEGYYVYLVERDALFPLAAGTQVFEPLSIAISPAGTFFQRPRDVIVTSEQRKLIVKPLPEAGRPAAFIDDNVGELSLRAAVRPTSTTTNQPITLTLIASGRGNLERLRLPTWDKAPSNARLFPPSQHVDRDDTGRGVEGKVMSEMLVQPLSAGTLHIPSFSLWTFDPGAGAYREARTEPIDVVVREGNGAAAPSGGTGGEPARQTLARGARPIHTGLKTAGASSATAVVPAGLGALLFGALCGVAGGLRARRRRSSAGVQAAAQKRRAKALAEAEAQRDGKALAQIVVDALAERFGADVRALPVVSLEQALIARGLPPEGAARVRRFLEDSEAARYAPKAAFDAARMAGEAKAIAALVDGRG
jgi:hypothetical protein